METVKKILGAQGSWEATVTYSSGRQEELACVHQYYWRNDGKGPWYEDPWTPQLRQTPKFAKHVALIQSSQRVILTTDKINEVKKRGEGFFERTGYVAVFTIVDFALDDQGMRFHFKERIPHAPI
jgi:hypothetical protein